MIGGKHPTPRAAAVARAVPSAAVLTGHPTAAALTSIRGRAVPGMLGGKHYLARSLARQGGDARP